MKTGVMQLMAMLPLIVFAMDGCCKNCPPPEPDVVYVPPLDAVADAGTEDPVEAQTTCGKACAKLRSFGCAEGHSTPSGGRCYDVCRSAPTLIRADCIAAATSRDSVQNCHVRCLKQ